MTRVCCEAGVNMKIFKKTAISKKDGNDLDLSRFSGTQPQIKK